MSAAVIFTRDQLYAMVWSKPISKIGPKFGVSGNAIVKICKKLDVPRPPRGYWTKLVHGKHVKQSALPPLKKNVPQSYCLNPQYRASKEEIPVRSRFPRSRLSRESQITTRLWRKCVHNSSTGRKISLVVFILILV